MRFIVLLVVLTLWYACTAMWLLSVPLHVPNLLRFLLPSIIDFLAVVYIFIVTRNNVPLRETFLGFVSSLIFIFGLSNHATILEGAVYVMLNVVSIPLAVGSAILLNKFFANTEL